MSSIYSIICLLFPAGLFTGFIWLGYPVVLALLPILIFQASQLKKNVPRLPGAAGLNFGRCEGIQGEMNAAKPIRLVVLGESTVAGVGVDNYHAALAEQTAAALARRLVSPVEWLALGRNGASAATARQRLVRQIPVGSTFDVVCLAFGVNDIIELHSISRWLTDMRLLIAEIRARVGDDVPIVLASVPPMGRFPGIPQPLRQVLGWRASSFDYALRLVARRLLRVVYSPSILSRSTTDFFGVDQIHPSAAGYTAWGAHLAQSIQLILNDAI